MRDSQKIRVFPFSQKMNTFNKYKDNILKDHTIQNADVIFLTETWLAGGQCQENGFPLRTFAAYVSYGKGKGCATFSLTAFQAFSVVKKSVSK